MASKTDILEFIAQPRLALIGVSRTASKFSNAAAVELAAKGYAVYPVNRAGGMFNSQPIYTSLSELPDEVDTVLVMVRPEHAAEAARECAAAGVRRIWFQRGAESPEALEIAEMAGMRVVSGECILMYAGKSGFHKFHRFFRELFGSKLAA